MSAQSPALSLILTPPCVVRCYTKERAGSKYYSTVVRDVITVSSLSLCAGRCGSEEFCNSFSFRFSTYNDQDNCLLSGLNTSNILPNSDLVSDPDWDVWQYRCKDSSSRDFVLRQEASKMSSSVVDATSAVSDIRACARRCEDMAGCQIFAFSSQSYTNCQVTRLRYSHLGRTDIRQDAKWDLFEMRTTGGGGGGGVHFPNGK